MHILDHIRSPIPTYRYRWAVYDIYERAGFIKLIDTSNKRFG